MVNEIWKPIKGYEGRYSISNKGNVKSESRYVKSNLGMRFIHEHILKPIKMNTGYYAVNLRKINKNQMINIHRLVAENFVDGYSEIKDTVNHINGIKTDNRAENLEWVTHGENIELAWKTGLCHTSELTGGIKSVNKINLKTGEILQSYKSIAIAARENNLNPSGIGMVVIRKKISCGGYGWQFVEDKDKRYPLAKKTRARAILQIDKNSKQIIAEYKSVQDASIAVCGKITSSINTCCLGVTKSSHGYIWMFKDKYIRDGKLD